ncbi:hypothetical protein RHS03_00539, partial [Rhizoctonia solani]
MNTFAATETVLAVAAVGVDVVVGAKPGEVRQRSGLNAEYGRQNRAKFQKANSGVSQFQVFRNTPRSHEPLPGKDPKISDHFLSETYASDVSPLTQSVPSVLLVSSVRPL